MAPPRPAPGTAALAARAEPPASLEVLGVPLALTDYGRALDWMDAAIAARRKSYVCVAAVHTVMACREDPELLAAVRAATFTVPDGQPLVWALNALGAQLPGRVYGPDLMAKACARAARTGTRMFLYGGKNQGALVQLTLELRTRYPGLQIVGGHAPVFRPLSVEEQAEVAQKINGSGADLVWVGLGVPRQEKWMAAMRSQLEAPVLIGVGAAFDFHAGLVAQAPAWLQRMGLEWAFRLAMEPRRLWKRYAKYNPLFVWRFGGQYARHLRSGSRGTGSA
jgi:N-acetylglucosaminyldiphosphoundecaprenol N-acetyl-beta-D-mannosaminyltransferase